MTDSSAGEAVRKRGRPTETERAQRRDEILDAAQQLFLERGYGDVSLDQIASAASVTKRTIYAYVGDKTAVFAAVVSRLNQLILIPAEHVDLEALAIRLVLTLHSDVAISLHRMVIAEALQFPDLARSFHAAGPQKYIDTLGDLIGNSAAAEQLFAVLLGEPHRRRLLGLDGPPTPAEAEAHAKAALSSLRLQG
ncbi:TetR/AcrR family transcriptional regulator [Kribbella sp. NBC_00709]|uniref:TetR/AcrR family transcriptional regulator n=1 Tax=Kribbella sp. NBC_00709 TaxID=2975972 RepID=UPI002E2A96CD|nr:TetR/AcrR family transcriptional regulator [Kribbella sp. NBC_00709]